MRGKFISDYIESDFFEGSTNNIDCNPNIKYTVNKLENGNYHFHFKNNSILPKFILTYRNDISFYSLTDHTFFQYAMNSEIAIEDTVMTYPHWGCGTGLGKVSINPYEEFNQEYTYEYIVEHACYPIYLNGKDSILTDPIYTIPIDSLLLSSDKNNAKIADSVTVSFTIALYTISGKESFRVNSNPINIAYIDLLKSRLKLDEY